MSLKGVHVCFIAVCLLLTLGFGVWGLRDWHDNDVPSSLYLGIGSFISGGILAVYGVWFLKKSKNYGFV